MVHSRLAMDRRRTPPETETAVLVKCARRCALCFGLSHDLSEKHGQIAHLDKDPSNCEEDNLAFLCVTHHSLFDSRTSQHKNYTIHEVKTMRAALHGAISRKEHIAKSDSAPVGKKPTPSLVFVVGAPLGENNSPSWMMMLKHFGPSPAYNCKVELFDDDRKNIEHDWLVRHPNLPSPLPGLVGGSQKLISVPEAGAEGSIGSFVWNPLYPDRQHYHVSISCRDGIFVERWEVTRVDGILRAKITIERGPQWVQKNPTLESTVFKCEDPEFIRTPLATELPKWSPRKVHSGWKPNHRFDVPVAIIDPNGHVQTMSGIKLPDGSLLTDFGFWNVLTRHFGDG